MADEILLPDDPEYHLKYDTNGMTKEDHAKLVVNPVKVPITLNYNINRMFAQLRTEIERKPGEEFDAYEDRLEHEMAKLLMQVDQKQVANLLWKWEFWARDNQVAPTGTWTYWLLLAGRGFGKTRTGAEWINKRVELGQSKRIALVAATAADVRKTMVEGESGILAKAPPWNKPVFEPSKLQLTWPNGAIAQMFSAEEPERLRGPQCDTFWADELCAWKKMQETWDMLMFGFRLGRHPQGCITTTPKPVPLIKEIKGLSKEGLTKVTSGSTKENKGNLAEAFIKQTIKKYEGTRLGRQELDAVILEDMPGALWKREDIDRKRIQCATPPIKPFLETDISTGLVRLREGLDWVTLRSQALSIRKAVGEDLTRLVVAVDPNASSGEDADETGITVEGKGLSGQGYLLADVSLHGTPNEWASTAVLMHDIFECDRIIGEANMGGNMVEHALATAAKFLKIQGLRQSDFCSIVLVHATRGKVTRAEPVSMLYEQGRISHVGSHPILEDQMCLFTSDFDRKEMGYSPDRVDSLVWGFTHLFLEATDTGIIEFYQQQAAEQQQALKASNPDPSTFTKMKAPPGVGQAYGIEGDLYTVDNDGFIFVPSKELRGLRQAGYVATT
jgi:phage terminase large subunit-like protein